MNLSLKNNLVCLGTIVNVVGLKGEVKVLTDSSFIEERFSKGAKIFLENELNNFIELISRGYRFQKKNVVVSFENYETIDLVEKFKNKLIYAKKSDLKLKKNQFHFDETINYDVFYDKDKFLGKVNDYWFNGIYFNVDILQKNGKIINIPVLEKFVIKINKKAKQIILDLPIGYLE